MRFASFSALIVLASSFVAHAQNVSFELKRDAYPDFGGLAMTQGDFNLDGKPDIVYAGGASGATAITLRLGNGDGTFQAPITLGSADSAQVYEIESGDFNLDGNLDVAVMCIGGTFDVFYGDGQGGLQKIVATATAFSPRSIAVADLNGDGLPDIAIGDAQGNLEIFNNIGGQNFASNNTIPIEANSYITVRAGDFDDDGIQSLAVLTNTAAYVFWNDGHGNFSKQLLMQVAAPVGVSVADLNQDGMADILLSYDCNPDQNPGPKGPYSTCQGVQVFYGQGKQKLFQRSIIVANGAGASGDLHAVDVNGDGVGDIVTAQTTGGAQTGLTVYLGHPDGSYDQTPNQFIATTDSLGTLAAGDYNRDGMTDFVAALPGSGQIEIFLNATLPATCATSQINPTVTACAPINNTYLPGPNVRAQANAYDTNQVTALQLYVNGNLQYSQPVTSFNQNFSLPAGPVSLVFKAWDYTGMNFQSDRKIYVYNGTPGSTCSAALDTAVICLPAATVPSGSPVHILANGYTAVVPTSAQLYIDGTLAVQDNGCSNNTGCGGGASYIETYQSLATGAHDLVFKLWDANGNIYTAEKTVTVQ